MTTKVFKTGGQIAPIIPTTIDEVFRLAQGIAKSGLAPKSMTTPEQISIALMTGLELGLPPMQAIQRIAVVNGRPTLWGDAIPALLWARGFKLREWTVGDTAHCEVTRPEGDKIERTFSDSDAKAAGLLGKPGPWTQYRPRMRQMRARGFACRDGAADVLAGLYLAEEVQDASMKDVTPAAPELPDIPDVPDLPTDEPSQDEPSPVANVDEYLEHYGDELAALDCEARLEFIEANADIVERLPPKARAAIARMIGEAA